MGDFPSDISGRNRTTLRHTADRGDRTMSEASFEARDYTVRDESSTRSSADPDGPRRENKGGIAMRKNAEYAVARRNGAITVSLDEAENLLERRGPTDPQDRHAGAGAAGRENPTHQRRAAEQLHRRSRQHAHKAGQRARGLLSRAWHSLFPARSARDDSGAP